MFGEIAVVDDAFIEITSKSLTEDEVELVTLALGAEGVREELETQGLVKGGEEVDLDVVLASLTDVELNLGILHAALHESDLPLITRLEERRAMLAIVKAMRAVSQCVVHEIKPQGAVPDLRNCDIIFLDYYLEGTKSAQGGDLAERWAAEISANKPRDRNQLLVLMSSLDSVGQFKRSFREKANVAGGAFMFVGKSDMDETWKVGAHLKSLAGALPHSSALNDYIAAISSEIDAAKSKFDDMLKRLDMTDFAYIQNLSLQADGHPLGDYLSWLLSTHLASLVFEGALRDKQKLVDEVVFDHLLMTPIAPTTEVAHLYHSAQFSRRVGALGKHPRDKGDTWIPLLQLGDVFLTKKREKAVVILSADCDLAFTPDAGGRAPDPDRSVILVQGAPVRMNVAKKTAEGSAAISFTDGDDVYQIDWDFRGYKAIPLDMVRQYLRKEKYETGDHDRLRPLYALKLQQEFAAHAFRIGAPVVPPVMRGVRAEVWSILPTGATKLRDLEREDLVEISHESQQSLVITLSLASELRIDLQALAAEVYAIRASHDDTSDPKGRQRTRLGGAEQELRDLLKEDAYWQKLVSRPVPLPEAGKTTKGRGLSFFRAAEISKFSLDEPKLVVNLIEEIG
ncbi:hypothetical protein RWK44_28130 [Rhizobium sp. 25PS6]|uniref:hypothetical protein n=1 Tax=Rhizobium sp. 25PS6 TaxID=3075622 RepID=UPI0028FDB218|nr:hypothetical protein [Rhizobium sp. 25PS6]MDU0364266.1 hypothetical protein [Rhizobium sp. 25PS6]